MTPLHHGLDSTIVAEFGLAILIGVLAWIASLIACPIIMSKKGRSGVLGFVLGLFLGVIGIIVAILLPPASDNRLSSRGRPIGFSREQAERLGVPPPAHGGEMPADTQICSSCKSKIPLDATVCRVCQLAIAPVR